MRALRLLAAAISAALVFATPLAGLLPALAAPVPDSAAPVGPKVLFHIADERIDEASGLGVGIRSPGVLYVQNDSGDRARFFALDSGTGQVRAECVVPGAKNVDWEDLAIAPDQRGVPSVWLGDIGDNGDSRPEIAVYRVDEPRLPETAATIETGPPDVWRLRYPDGPRNAEALLVDPLSHRIYIATKSLFGRAEVYQAPLSPDASRVQTMTRIGSVQLSLTGTAGGPNLIGQLTVTGASMSADGQLLALRTYTDAYVWRVTGSDVATALRAEPEHIPLPAQPLGEGIAIRGTDLLVDSEGIGSAVYSLPIGKLAALAQPSATTSSPSERTTPSATPQTTSPRTQGPVSAPSKVATTTRTGWAVWWIAAGAGLCAVAVVVLVARRRGR